MITKEEYLNKVKHSKLYLWADNNEDRQQIIDDATKVWERHYKKNKQHSKDEEDYEILNELSMGYNRFDI